MVDLTGFADRGTGTYSVVRSAGLGYFFGEEEICQHLSADGASYCDEAMQMLMNINDKKLGQLNPTGVDAEDLHPLVNR